MAKRGRPPSPKPGPDSYSSDKYQSFLRRLDSNSADLDDLKDDRKELVKAEVEQQLNRFAHQVVESLRTKVRKGKMTVQDAQATRDAVNAYFDWSGLADQRDMLRDQQPAATVARAPANGASANPPPAA